SVADLAKDIELTDEQIEQYYSENPLAYTRPEQAKVSYIELSAEALKSQLKVSDEAQKYYEEHLDKYQLQSSVKLVTS
ncbi:hypothetical protein BCU57_020525, partial [Shewanella sp. 10N.286.48.B5]